jgi:hypothetical protein
MEMRAAPSRLTGVPLEELRSLRLGNLEESPS